MKWLFDRLNEPSTWAGISGIVTPVVGVAAGVVNWQTAIMAALPAALAIFKAEAGKN
jgi:hypothetical protein